MSEAKTQIYEREKDGSFMMVIPTDGVSYMAIIRLDPRHIYPGRTQTVEVTLGAAGNPGFNIGLSTKHSLEEVLLAFDGFLDPNSRIRGKLYGESIGSREIKLAGLRPELKSPDGHDTCLRIQGQDPTKLAYFWYDSQITLKSDMERKRWFAFNTDHYDDEVFATACQLTDYPIHPIEILGLRAIFKKIAEDNP